MQLGHFQEGERVLNCEKEFPQKGTKFCESGATHRGFNESVYRTPYAYYLLV